MMFNDENEELMPLEELHAHRRVFWLKLAVVLALSGGLIVYQALKG